MYRYIHVAGRVSVMTTIYSIMVTMAEPVSEHCSRLPELAISMEKKNDMKTCTNVLQIIATQFFVKIQ